jgi:hypothetical protein
MGDFEKLRYFRKIPFSYVIHSLDGWGRSPFV